MTPPKHIGTAVAERLAVPADFTLPWNTTRTMADVLAEEKAAARSEHARKAGLGRARQKRQQYVEDYHKRMSLTPRGKIPFAGYDGSEA